MDTERMTLQAVLSPRRAFFLAMPLRGSRLATLRVHRPPAASVADHPPEASRAIEVMDTSRSTESFAPEQADFLRRLREAGL